MPISLFYHYTDVEDIYGIAHRLREFGEKRSLGGRIRVSREGINGTLGGAADDVHQFHLTVLEAFGNPAIDFKISEGGAKHFNSEWRVRVCDEVVTTGVSTKVVHWSDAAQHINADDFRSEIINRRQNYGSERDIVILDARNVYEHAIGRFDGAILPPIRQFSEFAEFIKKQHSLFDGKRVLMYCTGGVRCEKGSGIVLKMSRPRSVAQLQGGIDAFLKRFPTGGSVFRGKNLVFDGRLAVPTLNADVVGKCVCCGAPWDDYSSNRRCQQCRCRVLVCNEPNCVEAWCGDEKEDSLCIRCKSDNEDKRVHALLAT